MIVRIFKWLPLLLLSGNLVMAQERGRRKAPEQPPQKQPEKVEEPVNEDNTDDIMSDYAKMAAAFSSEMEEKQEVFFYECQHVSGETIQKILDDFLTPSGTVAASPESDIVIVSDVKDNIANLKAIAGRVDIQTPQIQVEARVVEFSVDDQFVKDQNISFQQFRGLDEMANIPSDYLDFVQRLTGAFVPTGSSPDVTQGSFSISEYSPGSQNLLTFYLKFLETKGAAKILSAPNLVLRRGAEGSIITGEEVPIQTQTTTSGSVSTSTEFKSVGIKLRVNPIMITNQKVRLEITPEVSNVNRIDDTTGAPIIAVRSATTELEINDGTLVSIGGLLRTEERETERRVPILSLIPYLGNLFKGKDTESVKSQLVIFLSVNILSQDEMSVDNRPVMPTASEKVVEASKKMEEDLRRKPATLKGDVELWTGKKDNDTKESSKEDE